MSYQPFAGAADQLLGSRSRHSAVAFGVLAAEALDTARCVHQALFAGVEWVQTEQIST